MSDDEVRLAKKAGISAIEIGRFDYIIRIKIFNCLFDIVDQSSIFRCLSCGK
jgi:hypothetical protein